eukprot:5231946-Karenia_brevis.AAC.1
MQSRYGSDLRMVLMSNGMPIYAIALTGHVAVRPATCLRRHPLLPGGTWPKFMGARALRPNTCRHRHLKRCRAQKILMCLIMGAINF